MTSSGHPMCNDFVTIPGMCTEEPTRTWMEVHCASACLGGLTAETSCYSSCQGGCYGVCFDTAAIVTSRRLDDEGEEEEEEDNDEGWSWDDEFSEERRLASCSDSSKKCNAK